MNKFDYGSIFAPYMNNFIHMKNACGYDALRTKWILLEFDSFFVSEEVKELHIRKVQIEKWRATRINDSERTLYSKYSVWSQFCRYMCHIGIECYPGIDTSALQYGASYNGGAFNKKSGR